MASNVETCIAEAEAAGWSGRALQHLILSPKSSTIQGFRAHLAEANEIRGLIKIVEPSIKAAGYDTDGVVEEFLAAGCSCASVRTETARIMAEHDAETAIDTTPRAKNVTDPYVARAAEIDEHKAKKHE
jgi:hypothetical protein